MKDNWDQQFVVDVVSAEYKGEDTCSNIRSDLNYTYSNLFTFEWAGLEESCLCQPLNDGDEEKVNTHLSKGRCSKSFQSACTTVGPIGPISSSNFSG